jgi:hypothetical protein
MSTVERLETSRTPCECGKGEFVFYTCEADRWLYAGNPHETWFEMHIFCESCSDLFQQNKLTRFLEDDETPRWVILIPEPDQPPKHS